MQQCERLSNLCLGNRVVTDAVETLNVCDRFGSEGKFGVLGDVLGFHFNPEEQNRGSLHYHGMVWLKYKPDANTFRARLQQPEFQKRILNYLSEIIKHEAPAQWKNCDPKASQLLVEADLSIDKHFDCPHCNSNHESIVGSGAKRDSASVDQHLACKRIGDPCKPLFAEEVLRDLTSLVGEMVTHDSNHHTSCFKYVKKTKHGKTNLKAKDCRYHFPKELGVRLRACCLVVTDQ